MTNNDTAATVQLGSKSYHLRPQKLGFLRRAIKDFTDNVDLAKLDTDASDVVGALGNQAHRALRIFVPGLMPDYEFAGFQTRDLYEIDNKQPPLEEGDPPPEDPSLFRTADEQARLDAWFDEVDENPDIDPSPSVPEIRKAFEVAVQVNGIDFFKHLKNLVTPDFLQAALTVRAAGVLAPPRD